MTQPVSKVRKVYIARLIGRCVILHPERFWEKTNEALKCSQCTDKLCTQYCQKSRRKNKKR